MKKIVIALAVSFLLVSMAHAGTKANCGCGIGSMAFEGNDGLISQVCAATTNGTFGNQTFGITSGTLGCDKPASFTENERVNEFVAQNMDNLAADIASGEGESLNTLAELIQVPSENRAAFFAELRTRFDEIYPSPDVTHTDVVRQIGMIYGQI